MPRNRSAKRQEVDLLEQLSFQTTSRSDYRDDFERTAVPHMASLRAYALHLTMNSENANDLLQETFLKAYRFWDKFEKGTNIKAWLYQIMKHSYINHYRKRVKGPTLVEFDESFSLPASETSALAALEHIEEGTPHDVFEDEVARSLDSLPSDFRTVVMLSDVGDFTYEEIAGVIAVPLGTVRSRLHRGRKLLRERLRHYAKSNRYLL